METAVTMATHPVEKLGLDQHRLVLLGKAMGGLRLGYIWEHSKKTEIMEKLFICDV